MMFSFPFPFFCPLLRRQPTIQPGGYVATHPQPLPTFMASGGAAVRQPYAPPTAVGGYPSQQQYTQQYTQQPQYTPALASMYMAAAGGSGIPAALAGAMYPGPPQPAVMAGMGSGAPSFMGGGYSQQQMQAPAAAMMGGGYAQPAAPLSQQPYGGMQSQPPAAPLSQHT